MRWLLNSVSTPLLGVLMVGVTTAAALAVFSRVRHRLTDPPEDNDMTAGMLGIVGAVYGIVLAFVIVTVWQNFDHASDTTKNEAAALAQLTRDVRVLDDGDQARIDGAVASYVHAVTTDEWTTMRHGRASPRAEVALDRLGTALEHTTPGGGSQPTWYEEAVHSFNEVVHSRHDRLEAAQHQLPAAFHVLLFGGAALPIWLAMLLDVRRRAVHTAVVAVVAVLISYSLFLAVILDHPFSGSVSVSRSPFERGALAHLPG